MLRALRTPAFIAFVVFGGFAFADDPSSAAPTRVYSNSRTVYVTYQLSAGPVAVKETRLCVTRDQGMTWSRAADAKSGATPEGDTYLEWNAPDDGTYGFETVAVDPGGVEQSPPAPGHLPALFLVIDTVPPAIAIQFPKGGETIKPGTPVAISWECTDPDLVADPVQIECSGDHGVTWEPVNGQERYPPNGTHRWTPPEQGGPEWMLRARATDRAENMAVATLQQSILVSTSETARGDGAFWSDTTPPSLINRRTFDIDYRIAGTDARNLGAVVLWYTADGGKLWTLYGRDADLLPPMTFTAPDDGDYGFYLVAMTSSWRASRPDPQPGTTPDRVTRVDTLPPIGILLAPREGDCWSAGSTQTLRWEVRDLHLVAKPVSLDASLDDGRSWMPIAREIENTGQYPWTLPTRDGSARVRLTAIDASGNVSTTDSGRFTLDNASVTVSITGIVESRKPRGDAATTPSANPVDSPGTTEPETVPPVKVDIATAQAAYDRGCLLRAQGNLPDAAGAFMEATRFNARFLDAFNDLGCVLFEQERYEPARSAFQKALEIDSADPEVLVNLAFAEVKLEADESALDHLRQLCDATSTASPLVGRAMPALRYLRKRFSDRRDARLAAIADGLLRRLAPANDR